MVLSQNGYSANDISQTAEYVIGDGRKVRLRRGDAGFLLKHFADWFDKHIEDIDQGADDWGYAARTIRGDSTQLSNHASGTALDLNATKHPLGKRGTFTAAKASAIRQRLKLYGGVIRWGGDYVNRADEMHFEINANAANVARIATTIRAGAAKETAVPLAHQRVVNDMNDRHLANLDNISAAQKTGVQPYSDAANDYHDAVQVAWDIYKRRTNSK